MSDILLIMDKLELMVRAVTKADRDGNALTVPADKKHENSFFKFDRHSSILENFVKNFWSQLNDPTRFRLFKLNFGEYKKNRETIKDLAEGKQTDKVKEFLEKYEIKPKNTQSESTNQIKENDMAKQNQNPRQLPNIRRQRSQRP